MSKSKNDTFTPFHPQILLGTLIASGSFLCVEEDGNRLLDVFGDLCGDIADAAVSSSACCFFPGLDSQDIHPLTLTRTLRRMCFEADAGRHAADTV